MSPALQEDSLPAEPSGSIEPIVLGETKFASAFGTSEKECRNTVRAEIHLNSACWESYWLFMQRL